MPDRTARKDNPTDSAAATLRLPADALAFIDRLATLTSQPRDSVASALLAAAAHFSRDEVTDVGNPETIAFIAIGANAAWEGSSEGFDPDLFGGYLGYISECTHWAVELDKAFAPLIEAGDLTCVFAYEVAEVFGKRYGAHLLHEALSHDRCKAGALIAELLAEQQPQATPEASGEGAALDAADAICGPHREYRVRWEIDVDGTSPEDAARAALEIQRDPSSIATVFEVDDGLGNAIAVDLSEDTPSATPVDDVACPCKPDVQTSKPTTPDTVHINALLDEIRAIVAQVKPTKKRR